jgi:glutaredoxin
MVGSVAGSARSTTVTSKEQIDFFWRPGCGFCMGLERSLLRAQIPFAKHNIWDDDENAAYVRSVARGNETVPTVRIGSVALVNPTLDQVVATMRSETPHLVPTSG